MSKQQRRPGGLSFYLFLLIAVVFIALFFNQNQTGPNLSYSELLQQIHVGNVSEASVIGNTLEVTFKNPVQQSTTASKQISPYWMTDLLNELKTAEQSTDLKFDYQEPVDFSMWLNLIMLILMFGAMAFFIWTMFSRQGGEGKGAMNFGRSRAKIADPSKNTITFKDVAGADEEKEELQEVVEFLKNPQKYEKLGAKIPRGILLVGPPGTGKTLLAKAVAGEAGVPFYSISGSDFVEMYVGVGASRVRDLFATAKKNAPSIIFIDEIDAVGRQRGTGLGGSHDEREQTLNQLLVEMDGFGPNEEAIIIAATNRADILDPALLRPGRFDRRIMVQRPDIKGRAEILRVHARNKPLDKDVDLREIARVTPGFTGADLANLLNEAALLAARNGQKTITYENISESVFKVMLGPEKKSRVISDKERMLTAYHEAGHALVLRTVSQTDRVERVSIIPAGGAGGYTAHKPHEDVYFMTYSQLVSEIEIALGGRAAEEIKFGEVSTGASSDLESLNSTARDMIVKYGMSKSMPNLVFGNSGGDEVFLGRDYGHVKNYSDEVAEKIDEEVARIVDDAYEHVLSILREKNDALEAIADELLLNEKIEGDVFEKIYLAHTTPEQRAGDAENRGRNEVFGFRKAEKEFNQPMAADSDSLVSSTVKPAFSQGKPGDAGEGRGESSDKPAKETEPELPEQFRPLAGQVDEEDSSAEDASKPSSNGDSAEDSEERIDR